MNMKIKPCFMILYHVKHENKRLFICLSLWFTTKRDLGFVLLITINSVIKPCFYVPRTGNLKNETLYFDSSHSVYEK